MSVFGNNTSPANTPRGFHVETTWKRPFPRRFNVESTWCVCRVMIVSSNKKMPFTSIQPHTLLKNAFIQSFFGPYSVQMRDFADKKTPNTNSDIIRFKPFYVSDPSTESWWIPESNFDQILTTNFHKWKKE